MGRVKKYLAGFFIGASLGVGIVDIARTVIAWDWLTLGFGAFLIVVSIVNAQAWRRGSFT